LVGIRDGQALLQGSGSRVEEQHLVSDGVADQQALAVRAERQVVRLAQHRDTAELLLGGHVDQADRGAAGIDDEGEAGRRGGVGKQKKEGSPEETHAAGLRRR
jgi:hypothetical protein